MTSQLGLGFTALALFYACVPNSGRFNPEGTGGAGTGGTAARGAQGGESGAAGEGTGEGGAGGEGGGGAAGPGVCGDGAVDGGERCDDRNPLPGDGCSAKCQVESGWRCDGSEPTVCDEVCGDGKVVGAEARAGGCDDGNVDDDDGCSAACRVEPGWFCGEQPSICADTCGNGELDGNEGCDDANVAPGDGCFACAEEPDWECTDEPSLCTQVNDCNPDPCDHGGVCADGVRSFTCDCSGTGFTGPTCEEPTDDCNPNPCENGGVCIDGNGDYVCQCDGTGYEGRTCQTNVNDCLPDPCLHGGVCSDLVNAYACDCTGTGYYGTTCELDAVDCTPDPCQNGGVCMEGSGMITCDCAGTGYEGSSCQDNVDDCLPNPCQNGGDCTDEVNGFTCDCSTTGYTGDTCQTNVNDCDPDPCQNGGTCTDGVNDYTCDCAGTGFTGMNCENEAGWTRQFGTSADDTSDAVAVDASGNVYVAGDTYGPLGGTYSGVNDGYVRKYNSGGTHQWTRQFGTTSNDSCKSVAVDGSSNVYVAGYTMGALSGTNTGVVDGYVRKYDSGGTHQWTRQFGTDGLVYAEDAAADASGNVYIAGHTSGSLGGTNTGGGDAFLRKYDSAGTHQWTQQFGTASTEYGMAVALNPNGDIYIGGFTQGSLGGTFAGTYDGYVRKYDSDGTHQWTRQFGTSSDDRVFAVAVDASGNVYATGFTNGSFGGANAGRYDSYVHKYDSAGTHQWTQQFGTPLNDDGYSIAVGASGSVYVTGYTSGSLGGTNAGSADGYVRKHDSDGTHQWTWQFGTQMADYGYGVALDASGNLYVAGHTGGSLGGTNAGVYDGLVLQIPGG